MARRWRGAVATVGVLVLLAAGVLVGGPWLLERAGLDGTSLPWGPDCVVSADGGPVELTREQAMAATTAVALRSRGEEAADPEGVPTEALEALARGPADAPGPVLTCRSEPGPALEAQEMTATGLTPRAEALLAALNEDFGPLSLGGFQPGGVTDGHGEGSAHYDGRAVDVFFRPVDEGNRRSGWVLAQWLVAHAERLEVSVVIFDDRIWSTRFAAAGWRGYTSADTGNDILQHRDHVHVDVLRGEG
ncbi:hypothetical protein [Actinorugispora endophytica]|uniref:ARB-07466-like C-terminal domain-containing protein n=1 Tax=Actinorugispora endophytica TaxID=1605990 RepID=A0A4R6V3K3_9ACTN|nr:hypothetical protein [Actinorugispora endophytica]TDQ53331.1 hypothetical protein EV190_104120 [Actinorugispora endophytica]